MFSISLSGNQFGSCNHRRKLLAVCWISGLLCGAILSISAADIYLPLMRGLCKNAVSIVSVLHVVFLPFLLSAFAVFLSAPVMILPVCFARAVVFACSVYSVLSAYGVAGWIISGVFLFSDWASLPVLYWYWRNAIIPEQRKRIPSFYIATALLAGIAWLDLRIISPFGAGLIDFIERVNG